MKSAALIATFCSPVHGGNLHRVRWRGDAFEASLSDVIDVEVSALETPQASAGCFSVICERNGSKIQFCGSGLLAAARFILSNQPTLTTLNLETGSRSAKVWQEGELLGLQVLEQKLKRVRKQSFWSCLLGFNFTELLYAGGEQGYAVVVASNAQQVVQAKIQCHRLSQYSGRALILTAPGRKPGEFVFRYFAPQYGINEDAATGSACSVLMPYWAARYGARYGHRKFRAIQLSAQGAMFFGKYSSPHVSILGSTQTLS